MDRRFVLAGLAGTSATLLSSATQARQYSSYEGPEITRIVVQKKARRLFLFSGKKLIKKYRIHLGFSPEGDKSFQGDGRTPEGSYYIDRRNPRSSFYLSLGISYPNARDRAEAAALGRSPGGDIFIHGQRRPGDPKGPDWTAGCIAVKNHEMREIYVMVKNGTRIDINP